MAHEYTIYCDESEQAGAFFGGFYGGVLVPSDRLSPAIATLDRIKREQNLFGEVKWQKVSPNYLAKYATFVDGFFDLLANGGLKARVMFVPAALNPRGLGGYQRNNRYFLLYYQFIKHAFGLRYSGSSEIPRRVRLYLDNIPDTREKRARFKAYVAALSSWREFQKAGVTIDQEQIAEVRSHDHAILQAIDVVLGAIQFRLNDKHRRKPAGSHRRGAKTIAKEKLYRHVLGRIRGLHPGFNVGITTGTLRLEDRWEQPYRHWRFEPKESVVDSSKTKRAGKETKRRDRKATEGAEQ